MSDRFSYTIADVLAAGALAKALKSCMELDDKVIRFESYAAAGCTFDEAVRFDAEAVRVEQLRRQAFKPEDSPWRRQ